MHKQKEKDMIVNRYYDGYYHSNGNKERIVFENGDYFFKIKAKHKYVTITNQDCYDINGVLLGKYESKTYEAIEEDKVREIDKDWYRPIQINYEFKKLPLEYFNTQEEMQRLRRILNDSFNGDFEYRGIIDTHKVFFKEKYATKEDFYWAYYETKMPLEVNALGHSTAIYKKSYKSFLNLDFNEYVKKANNFKKSIDSDWHSYIDNIVEMNLEFIALYYMTTPKKLLSKSFNKLTQMQKRLHFNINQKQKQL